jgi:hypothetical protein
MNKREIEMDILTIIDFLYEIRPQIIENRAIHNENIKNCVNNLLDLCEDYYCDLCPGNYANTMSYQSIWHFLGFTKNENYFCKFHSRIKSILLRMLNLTENDKDNKHFYLFFYHTLDKLKIMIF